MHRVSSRSSQAYVLQSPDKSNFSTLGLAILASVAQALLYHSTGALSQSRCSLGSVPGHVDMTLLLALRAPETPAPLDLRRLVPSVFWMWDASPSASPFTHCGMRMPLVHCSSVSYVCCCMHFQGSIAVDS